MVDTAPGDGFLITGFVFCSLLFSVPLSLFLAGMVLFRKSKARDLLLRL